MAVPKPPEPSRRKPLSSLRGREGRKGSAHRDKWLKFGLPNSRPGRLRYASESSPDRGYM